MATCIRNGKRSSRNVYKRHKYANGMCRACGAGRNLDMIHHAAAARRAALRIIGRDAHLASFPYQGDSGILPQV